MMAAGDFIWARYIQHIQGKNPLRATLYAGLVVAIGGLTTIEYVSDHRLLLPAVLGAMAGTLIAVKRS